jgi:hypothetical protein
MRTLLAAPSPSLPAQRSMRFARYYCAQEGHYCVMLDVT